MLITGRVENGSGRNSRMAAKLTADYWTPLGFVPPPGTLNVRVTREDRAGLIRLPGVTIGRFTYRPATLNGVKCYVRTNRGPRTLEIVHPQRLRDKLTNGDTITLEMHEPRPMKLSAVIMAHPKRAWAVEELQAQLDREVPVIYDENPVPSADPEQRWATGVRAWEAHDPSADYHLVLQDDITVSHDLLAGAEQALTQLGPKGLLSLYAGTGRPDQNNIKRMLAGAQRRGYTWGSVRSLNWGCGIIAPVADIPGALEWCSDPATESLRPRNRNYDYRLGVYFRDVLGYRTWHTCPSLVEHRGLPSLIGHDTGDVRRAHSFHDGSALDIDWSLHAGLNPLH